MKKIPSRSKQCCINAEVFEPGDSYVSALSQKKGEWLREDFCLTCWQSNQREAAHWQGVIPKRKEKKLSPDEEAFAQFKKMEKASKLRYLLALYLKRKGMLVKRTADLYEVPETGEVYQVPVTPITQDVTEEFSYLFSTTPA